MKTFTYLGLALTGLWFSTNTLAYPMYGLIEPHRTLIYFSKGFDENVASFERQLLVHRCQIDDRDLHTLILDMNDLSDSRGLFSSQEIIKLMNKYRVRNNEHTAVLIGKDGTEKARWRQGFDINEMVQVIDEMPMRKAEIRERGLRCSI
ncbi:hypothetical protein RN22_14235 [Grimontia sp. AD028]|uniref:DUF4174 domain-containing protein n=1 Tax=Grimontia indica TaxID=1056512 RepID=R1J193_9GAMM|nr:MULTISPECIES: DUF4174 domain-containing protein [Grimontia]EOD81375.1 hypothetical protein D515_04277 [Grimontia indica]KKD59768.1 hypothetical protein RN22_14235 [Grimontia sp. AD028]